MIINAIRIQSTLGNSVRQRDQLRRRVQRRNEELRAMKILVDHWVEDTVELDTQDYLASQGDEDSSREEGSDIDGGQARQKLLRQRQWRELSKLHLSSADALSSPSKLLLTSPLMSHLTTSFESEKRFKEESQTCVSLQEGEPSVHLSTNPSQANHGEKNGDVVNRRPHYHDEGMYSNNRHVEPERNQKLFSTTRGKHTKGGHARHYQRHRRRSISFQSMKHDAFVINLDQEDESDVDESHRINDVFDQALSTTFRVAHRKETQEQRRQQRELEDAQFDEQFRKWERERVMRHEKLLEGAQRRAPLSSFEQLLSLPTVRIRIFNILTRTLITVVFISPLFRFFSPIPVRIIPLLAHTCLNASVSHSSVRFTRASILL